MRLLLIGCGKMGGALLHGWLASDHLTHVTVIEPGEAPVPSDPRLVRLTSSDQLSASEAFGGDLHCSWHSDQPV